MLVKMDETSTLKEKYIKTSIPTIKKLLKDTLEIKEQSLKMQQLTEDSTKIQQLISTKADLEKILLYKKEEFFKKTNELMNDHKKVDDLEIEKNKLVQEIQNLRVKKSDLKCTKTSQKDQEILNTGSRRFILYKELTRIRWHYSVEDCVKGLITDKNNYIKHFEYPADMDKNKLSDLLWDQIYLSTIHKTNLDD